MKNFVFGLIVGISIMVLTSCIQEEHYTMTLFQTTDSMAIDVCVGGIAAFTTTHFKQAHIAYTREYAVELCKQQLIRYTKLQNVKRNGTT